MGREDSVVANKKKSNKKNFWDWKIDEADLRNQVENYKTLGITKSYRGVAILWISGIICFSAVVKVFISGDAAASWITEILIFLPFLFFTYRGHRWAMVVLMLLWTWEATYSIYQAGVTGEGNVIMAIVWWLVIMPNLWKALKVENERKKLARVEQAQKANSNSQDETIFCRHCGKPLDLDSKFCISCGKAVNTIY